MPSYRTNVALSIKGDRVEKNTEIELSTEDAAMYDPADLVRVDGVEEAPVPEEPSIDDPKDMSLAQLRERAGALGLSTAGSKADLIERITLKPGEPDTSTDGDEPQGAISNP